MKRPTVNRWKVALIAVLIAVLTISIIPVQTARAQTTTSDLVVRLVSVPKHAKACEVFQVTFTVTNLGPDPADDLFVSLVLSDHFDLVDILNAPESLGAGETATITAFVKVTAFVPGETRTGRLLASATSAEFSSDPNPEDNFAVATVRLISRRVMSCPV
jgi:hypothetical protein